MKLLLKTQVKINSTVLSFSVVEEISTHLKDRTGPTSLKMSFSFSSVASYGMFPTKNKVKLNYVKILFDGSIPTTRCG